MLRYHGNSTMPRWTSTNGIAGIQANTHRNICPIERRDTEMSRMVMLYLSRPAPNLSISVRGIRRETPTRIAGATQNMVKYVCAMTNKTWKASSLLWLRVKNCHIWLTMSMSSVVTSTTSPPLWKMRYGVDHPRRACWARTTRWTKNQFTPYKMMVPM